MTTEAEVRQASSPQEALLALARGIDRIEAGSSWELPPAPEPEPDDNEEDPRVKEALARLARDESDQFVAEALRAGQQVSATVEDDQITVDLPPVDEARAGLRLMFASDVLGLAEAEAEAYAKGGPMWLYLSDRAFVMTLSSDCKGAMIADIEQDSPQAADEFARDVLKSQTPGAIGG